MAPTPAPTAVDFSWWVMPEQPAIHNVKVNAITDRAMLLGEWCAMERDEWVVMGCFQWRKGTPP